MTVYECIYFLENDSVADKIREFERDIGLTFVDSNEVDSEDSIRFVKQIDLQTSTTTTLPGLCLRKCGEGMCTFDSRGKQTCRCPFGKTGPNCQISEYLYIYYQLSLIKPVVFKVYKQSIYS